MTENGVRNSKSRGNSKYRLNANSDFQIMEAYKSLRTNVLFSLATSKNKIAIISSALPSEGKSTTCANLAIAMGQTGSKVLLIDADLRRPTQHKIFRLNNSKGLSRLIAGFDNYEDAVHKKVDVNLDVITSGPRPPIPSELLGSSQMVNLLAELSDLYDFILIDTPPVNVVTDALVFSGETAGILLAVRQKQTTYDELQKALDIIKFAQTNTLGVVITDVKDYNKSSEKYSKKYDHEYKL